MAKKTNQDITNTNSIKIITKEKVEQQEEKTKTSQLKKMNDSEDGEGGLSRFRVDLKKGLNDQQVKQRQEEGLSNNINQGSTKSIPNIIFSNIFTMFNVIVIAVSVWLATVNTKISYYSFALMAILNTIIGIVQEIRAKLTIDKLSLLSAPTATVIRNGRQMDIAVSEIVLDDVLVLTAGKQVCADCILKEGNVEVNESLLTGESDALVKKIGSSLYSGSFVVSGTCKAKVEKVGEDSYIEKLAKQAKVYKKPESRILKSLKLIVRIALTYIVLSVAFLFIAHVKYEMSAFGTSDFWTVYPESVRDTASLVMALVPSGLFLTTSVALSVSVMRLSRSNTLVQDLYCIEMLARVDVLCLDKTGTITDGSMTVKGVEEIKNNTGLTIKQMIALILGSLKDSNMTSVALEKEFGKAKRVNPLYTVPFSSARKYSAVSLEKYGTFLLGAPEFILKKKYDDLAPTVEKYTRKGYRVLLIGHLKENIKSEDDLKDIDPSAVAIILIEDTIREDALETLTYFKESGVDIKVISGDNALTVSMVAKRAGVENSEKYISLDRISDEKLVQIADQYTVFGRVTPNQKKILVEALKKKGKTVAMTGDGVNDILALKEADCSIAMASGSEAARNVSHLVLLDSNFSSLPKVVQEGRRVVNNVQKVATLFLTKTIFSFLLSFVILFMNYVMGIPIKFPIASNQLIIIELLAIGIPAFFLALEPNNNLIKGNFLLNVLKKALPGGLVVTVAILTIYSFSTSLDLSDKVSTMSTIVAAYVCLMVLYRVCQPFTAARRMLFGAMFTIYLACLFVKPLSSGMFEFTPLDVPQLLLVILLIVLTNSVLDFLTKLPANISNIILEKLRFKRVRIILEDREREQERKGILDRISDKLIGEDDLPTKKK